MLRVLADRRPLPARFLVLGSAAPELLRQSSESLAGRIHYHELTGFGLDEAGAAKAERLWLRGGFARSFGMSDASVRRYLELLCSLYLARQLAPWHQNERDVEIALRVLDDFCRFGHLDAGCAMYPGGNYRTVERCDLFQRFRRIPGDDRHDALERVFLVARIDALRRIADREVLLPGEARRTLQNRNADFFGRPRINRGLEPDRLKAGISTEAA